MKRRRSEVEAFENISVYEQCMEFYTDNGDHVRAMNQGGNWDVHIAEGDAFVRQVTVMRDDTDEPSDVWDKFIGGN